MGMIPGTFIVKDDLNVDDLKSIVASILFDLDNRSTFDGYTFYGGDMTIQ